MQLDLQYYVADTMRTNCYNNLFFVGNSKTKRKTTIVS